MDDDTLGDATSAEPGRSIRPAGTREWSRKEIQDFYIRCCRDSGFRFDAIRAAQFAGSVLRIHPLLVLFAFPHIDDMERIARNDHPACARETGASAPSTAIASTKEKGDA